MGNCQAVDAAALVIQHPSGKIERFYWPMRASEVMRVNPGYYVSLIMPLPVPEEGLNSNNNHNNQEQKGVLFTRVKLLKPEETLTLGHAYRLIATQGSVCFLTVYVLFCHCFFPLQVYGNGFVVFYWFSEVMKVMKAKKRKPRGNTVEAEQMGHLEEESSACETGGMLDTGKIYQVWFCYSSNSHFFWL